MSSSRLSCLLARTVPFLAAVALGFALGRLTHDTGSRPLAEHAAEAAPSSVGKPKAVAPANPSAMVEDLWQRGSQQPLSAASERELVAAIEEMAKRSPDRALAYAAKAPLLRMREALRNAALRGWATTAPDTALAAAMKLPGIDNRPAIAAVLQGAAADPETVRRLARQIANGTDPVALDYGTLAISALAEHGHFDAAMRFGLDAPPANQALWLNAAFTAWARERPAEALAALDRVVDPALRHEAWQGVVAGWAESDPASLADHARREPVADDRALALGQTLTNWVLRDPVSASQWLSQRDPDPSLDSGLVAVASMEPLIAQRPEVAAEWAQAISDPRMRRDTLRAIGNQWRRQTPTALQQFLDGTPSLSPADRNALLGGE